MRRRRIALCGENDDGIWRTGDNHQERANSATRWLRDERMRGEKPTRSLLALECDWETTYLIRRIEFLEMENGIRRLVLFVPTRSAVQGRAGATRRAGRDSLGIAQLPAPRSAVNGYPLSSALIRE